MGPVRVGLTGGVASGKSTVAAILTDLGAVVVDADVLAREVVARGTEGLAAVVDALGAEVLTDDGDLDRPAVGRLVFGDPERRRALEAVVHPRVRARAAELESAAPEGVLVVHDIPLLVETGQARDFDAVLVVDVPVEVQLARMTTDRGMDPADARARVEAQATREQRLDAATHVIDNDGTREQLRDAVAAVHRELTARLGGVRP